MILVLLSNKQTTLFWKPSMFHVFSGDSYEATFQSLVAVQQLTTLSSSIHQYNTFNTSIQNVFPIFSSWSGQHST